ncbi:MULTISPECIES: helix-turn-helix domain-containing protein [Gracilibacillus]|uniref:helix-turn-helix domain-containing protein n=1 Tax=Gracilibacillus TaxID=74385 RepID=UPI0006D239B1
MLVFQERLKELREQNNIKQEEMAKKLNISTSAYGYYEQGRNEPSLETIQAIAETFHVSTDYLLGLKDNKRSDIQSISDLQLTYEELDTVYLMKQIGLLKELSRASEADLQRMQRLWKFLQNEMQMEKSRD